MRSVSWTFISSSSSPHLNRPVITSGGNSAAIGRPCHRSYLTRMPRIGEDVATIGSIPYLHVIGTTRGDALAIRRPSQRKHRARMSRIGEGVATIDSIPHLHSLIVAPRGDAFAIRRPYHCIHPTSMPRIGEDVRKRCACHWVTTSQWA